MWGLSVIRESPWTQLGHVVRTVILFSAVICVVLACFLFLNEFDIAGVDRARVPPSPQQFGTVDG